MDAYLDAISTLERHVELFNAKICKHDDRARLLMTMPGIDYLTALTILSDIVNVRRFRTPWKLVSYAGLAPSRRDSGESMRRGGITKRGSRWLRHALVEAAILHDERLGSFYRRIEERRGAQKAIVATAKEMLVIILHMLSNNEQYRNMDRAMVERKYKRMEWRSNSLA